MKVKQMKKKQLLFHGFFQMDFLQKKKHNLKFYFWEKRNEKINKKEYEIFKNNLKKN